MMWKNPVFVLLMLIYALLFHSCAQPGRLTGGPEDKSPPVLNKAESSPNLQTNFTKSTIELTFDEWLKLENTYKEVVVSPPLQFSPEVKLKGKTVRFNFHEEEELREEATYTINFGKSVKDLNAGNVVENLRFVFSTGPFIDSLKVKGNILDVESGKGVEDVLLMLYDNLADTVVRTERPFYFARTDNSGNFTIENVKSDTFKVFALVDDNLNYLFDVESEKIGFLEDPILLPDSTNQALNLTLFQEELPLRLFRKDSTEHGQLKLVFNKAPQAAKLNYENIGQKVFYQYDKDTIQVWYDQAEGKDWPLYIQIDTLLDTVMVSNQKRPAFLEKAKLRLTSTTLNAAIKLNPAKMIRLSYNHPLQSFDTAFIRCYEDSIKTLVPIQLTIDSIERQEVEIRYKWKENTTYELQLFPNAMTDIFGLKNQDTLIQSYQVQERAAFGDIKLKLEDIAEGKYYLLQLLFKNDNLVEEFAVGGDSVVLKTFTALPPGNYSLRIVEDRNNNQRWDTGNYDRQEQPERRVTRSIEELRASWEVEATISLKF